MSDKTLSGTCPLDGSTHAVSPRCEVWMSDSPCSEPTTHFYPAMGGGTMALCEEHAQKHLPHGAWPVRAARSGDRDADGGDANAR